MADKALAISPNCETAQRLLVSPRVATMCSIVLSATGTQTLTAALPNGFVYQRSPPCCGCLASPCFEKGHPYFSEADNVNRRSREGTLVLHTAEGAKGMNLSLCTRLNATAYAERNNRIGKTNIAIMRFLLPCCSSARSLWNGAGQRHTRGAKPGPPS